MFGEQRLIDNYCHVAIVDIFGQVVKAINGARLNRGDARQ